MAVVKLADGHGSIRHRWHGIRCGYSVQSRTNNYTAKITCLNEPTEPIKMRIKNNQVVNGSALVVFVDIYGETDLKVKYMYLCGPERGRTSDLSDVNRTL